MAAMTLSTVRPWKTCTIEAQAWSRWRSCAYPVLASCRPPAGISPDRRRRTIPRRCGYRPDQSLRRCGSSGCGRRRSARSPRPGRPRSRPDARRSRPASRRRDLRRDPAIHRRRLPGLRLAPCRNHPRTRALRSGQAVRQAQEGRVAQAPQKGLEAHPQPVESTGADRNVHARPRLRRTLTRNIYRQPEVPDPALDQRRQTCAGV